MNPTPIIPGEIRTDLPPTPFLIFQGSEARIAEHVEGSTIHVTDPDEGFANINKVDSSIFRTSEMVLNPKETPKILLGSLPLVTHSETILDPAYQRLPYIQLTYRLLEQCTRRPAYRIALTRMAGETSYELRYSLNRHLPGYEKHDPVCVITHVWFTDSFCLFTTPVTQIYKALLSGNQD